MYSCNLLWFANVLEVCIAVIGSFKPFSPILGFQISALIFVRDWEVFHFAHQHTLTYSSCFNFILAQSKPGLICMGMLKNMNPN